uniref:Uncharacterized protein n=1 Tax=Utricularia reniformis TaxID=192314 RepID=A0A1Y0B0A4_9LAMI|nr:hypothetical protein AEK19_MT0553 [Utricularia reniformis]ART30808.1 hypothetical protein AEK19_MT0553 [Utricularia reniformis]
MLILYIRTATTKSITPLIVKYRLLVEPCELRESRILKIRRSKSYGVDGLGVILLPHQVAPLSSKKGVDMVYRQKKKQLGKQMPLHLGPTRSSSQSF